MKFSFNFIAFSFLTVLFCVSVKAQNAGEKSLGILTTNKITGAWRINYAESDNPLSKMQALLQNKLSQSQNEKNISAKEEILPAMSVSLFPPGTLILAGDEKSITVNEAFSEVVFTRTVLTDGKLHTGELRNGSNFSLTASKKSDFLKIETVSPRGNKMIETFELSNGGKRLIEILRFEDNASKEIITLRRVYDRKILDLLSPGAEDSI